MTLAPLSAVAVARAVGGGIVFAASRAGLSRTVYVSVADRNGSRSTTWSRPISKSRKAASW